MNKKKRVLQELRENDDVSSLSEARKLVKQKEALQNLSDISQKLGLYPDS